MTILSTAGPGPNSAWLWERIRAIMDEIEGRGCDLPTEQRYLHRRNSNQMGGAVAPADGKERADKVVRAPIEKSTFLPQDEPVYDSFSMKIQQNPSRRLSCSAGRTVALSFAAAALVTCHIIAVEPSAPRAVATVEGVTEYQFDNGLRALLFPDNSQSKVTVNLTVLVGSRHEGYGETGMAHLLEHMVFKGTPRHPKVPKALQEHGAQWNGTTSDDRTNYFETMPATDENLEFGIALEADRLVNSFIKGEDLTSEMVVVRNEFERSENAPTA